MFSVLPIFLKMSTQKQLLRIQCNFCDYAGDSKNKLAQHMGDIHRKHLCGQGGEKFGLRTELDIHMKTIHASKSCQCEKLFDNEMDLQLHIKATHMARKALLVMKHFL